MAGTAKILKDINYTRDEINHTVDLLSKKIHTKKAMTEIMRENLPGITGFALLLGIFAALFSGKTKGFLKLALLFYLTQKSISRLTKS